MKERPILFSAEMVRALLAGTKTQTRRVVKVPYPGIECTEGCYADRYNNGEHWTFWSRADHKMWAPVTFRCPYGVPGDRLWVREAWCPRGNGVLAMERVQRPFYRAADDGEETAKPLTWKWRPSIFMPRWASRITLEITDVRVQRLQDISEEDARAEGVFREDEISGGFAALAYSRLWDRINGEGAWTANPWYWCLTFKRIDA